MVKLSQYSIEQSIKHRAISMRAYYHKLNGLSKSEIAEEIGYAKTTVAYLIREGKLHTRVIYISMLLTISILANILFLINI